MNRLHDIWTERRLFQVENGVPVALKRKIWVEFGSQPPVGVEDNQVDDDNGLLIASLAELTGRLGMQLLSMPQAILGELFDNPVSGAESQFHPIEDMSRHAGGSICTSDGIPSPAQGEAPGCQLVVSVSEEWLRRVLPAGVELESLCSERAGLQNECGLIALVEHRYIVVTAKSQLGVLQAVRYLVSEGCGKGLPEEKMVKVLQTGNTRAQSGNSAHHLSGALNLLNLFYAGDPSANDSASLYQESGDVLPKLQVSLAIHPYQPAPEAILRLVSRLALEAGAIYFPMTHLVSTEAPPADTVTLEFHVVEGTENSFIESREGSVKFVAPSDESMIDMVDAVIDDWFETEDSVRALDWRGKLAAIQSAHPDVAVRARAEMTLSEQMDARPFSKLTAPNSVAPHLREWCTRHGVELESLPAPLLWKAQWADAGELAEIEGKLWTALQRLSEKCNSTGYIASNLSTSSTANNVESGDEIQIEVLTSVSEPAFEVWVDKLKAQWHKDHTPMTPRLKFVYRYVNKAGLHWCLRDVLPKLETLAGEISSITISARRFDLGESCLELPQRFLQEMFPVDAILAQRLSIPINRIHLNLHDAHSDQEVVPSTIFVGSNRDARVDGETPMFRIVARDADNRELGRWEWTGLTEVLEYMPNGEAQKKVCAPAAGFRVHRRMPKGHIEIIASETVSTNYTRFWLWFQHEVVAKIPAVVASGGRPVLEATPSVPSGPTPFQKLVCDVFIDGREVQTGIYEEVTSFPEALHEDIYFYTLHALQTHSRATGNPAWETPGAIIPLVHIREGAPSAEIRLYGYDSSATLTLSDCRGSDDINHLPGREVHLHSEFDVAKICVNRVSWSAQGWKVAEIAGVPTHTYNALMNWLNREESSCQQSSDAVNQSPNLERDILQNEDIGRFARENQHHLPGWTFVLDYSFQGRPIWAFELMAPIPATHRTSRAKHMLYKPTLFITARHHANEISSTNSALWLLKELTANPERLGAFNLVILPLQNVDGAALHETLTREHPFWKHHAARFNACGFEFSRHYFNEETPFGESRTMKSVYIRWKPDIYLDDHGIPSHEWIQPFSGYNSPPYFPVSYWIPHAQMYTIWHQMVGEQPDRAESLRQLVSRKLAHDDGVRIVNEEFLTRYRRWGNAFAPEKFPVNTVDNVITYLWNVEPNPNSRGLTARYPEWVTAELITEVNDETVHGDALFAVARAHSIVHKGILEWLEEASVQVRRNLSPESNGAVVSVRRQRPLVGGRP